MSEERKRKPIKVRKSWVRNPAEQVVPNEKVVKRANKRQLIDEALDDLEYYNEDF